MLYLYLLLPLVLVIIKIETVKLTEVFGCGLSVSSDSLIPSCDVAVKPYLLRDTPKASQFSLIKH